MMEFLFIVFSVVGFGLALMAGYMRGWEVGVRETEERWSAAVNRAEDRRR